MTTQEGPRPAPITNPRQPVLGEDVLDTYRPLKGKGGEGGGPFSRMGTPGFPFNAAGITPEQMQEQWMSEARPRVAQAADLISQAASSFVQGTIDLGYHGLEMVTKNLLLLAQDPATKELVKSGEWDKRVGEFHDKYLDVRGGMDRAAHEVARATGQTQNDYETDQKLLEAHRMASDYAIQAGIVAKGIGDATNMFYGLPGKMIGGVSNGIYAGMQKLGLISRAQQVPILQKIIGKSVSLSSGLAAEGFVASGGQTEEALSSAMYGPFLYGIGSTADGIIKLLGKYGWKTLVSGLLGAGEGAAFGLGKQKLMWEIHQAGYTWLDFESMAPYYQALYMSEVDIAGRLSEGMAIATDPNTDPADVAKMLPLLEQLVDEQQKYRETAKTQYSQLLGMVLGFGMGRAIKASDAPLYRREAPGVVLPPEKPVEGVPTFQAETAYQGGFRREGESLKRPGFDVQIGSQEGSLIIREGKTVYRGEAAVDKLNEVALKANYSSLLARNLLNMPEYFKPSDKIGVVRFETPKLPDIRGDVAVSSDGKLIWKKDGTTKWKPFPDLQKMGLPPPEMMTPPGEFDPAVFEPVDLALLSWKIDKIMQRPDLPGEAETEGAPERTIFPGNKRQGKNLLPTGTEAKPFVEPEIVIPVNQKIVQVLASWSSLKSWALSAPETDPMLRQFFNVIQDPNTMDMLKTHPAETVSRIMEMVSSDSSIKSYAERLRRDILGEGVAVIEPIEKGFTRPKMAKSTRPEEGSQGIEGPPGAEPPKPPPGQKPPAGTEPPPGEPKRSGEGQPEPTGLVTDAELAKPGASGAKASDGKPIFDEAETKAGASFIPTEKPGILKVAFHNAKQIAKYPVTIERQLRFITDRAVRFIGAKGGPEGKVLETEHYEWNQASLKKKAASLEATSEALKEIPEDAQLLIGKLANKRVSPENVPENVREAEKILRDSVMDVLMHHSASVGIPRVLPSGEKVYPKGSGQWFAEFPNEDYRQALVEAKTKNNKPSPHLKKYIVYWMTKDPKNVRTEAEAMVRIRKDADNWIQNIGYLQSSRGERLPDELIEWDPKKVLPVILDKGWRMVEAVRMWGPGLTKLNDRISKIGEHIEGVGDYNSIGSYANKIHDFYKFEIGQLPQKGFKNERTFWAAMSNYLTVTRLAGSWQGMLRNSLQTIPNSALLPTGVTLEAWEKLHGNQGGYQLWARNEVDRDMALKGIPITTSALTELDSRGMLGSSAKWAMKGWTKPEQANQTVAAIAANIQMDYDLNRLIVEYPDLVKRSGFGKMLEGLAGIQGASQKAIFRRLEKIGLTEADIRQAMALGSWTEAQKGKGAFRFEVDTEFPAVSVTRREWERGGTGFWKVLFKFKSFQIDQFAMVANHVFKEAAHGNMAPLTRYLFGTVVVGELYNLLKDLVESKEKSITKLATSDQSFGPAQLGKRLLNNFVDGGGIGMLMDFTYGIREWIGGPALGAGMNLEKTISQIATQPASAGAAVKELVGREVVAVKKIGQLKDYVESFFEDDAKRFLGYGKWRERARVFMEEHKYPDLGDQFGLLVSNIFGSKESHKVGEMTAWYRQAKESLLHGDTAEAATWLSKVYKASEINSKEDRLKVERAAAQSLRYWGPLSQVTENQGLRKQWLSRFPSDQVSEAMELQHRFTANMNEVLKRAWMK